MIYYYENLAMEEAVSARIYIRKSSSDDCDFTLARKEEDNIIT